MITLKHATSKIPAEVMELLGRCEITENSVKLPDGQLDRKLYESFNKVMTSNGGKWNTKAKAHIFAGNARESIGMALETGTTVNTQKLFQAFYTPQELAASVVEWAEVSGHHVLEPSAGGGSLVRECLAQGASRVTAVEINPDEASNLMIEDVDLVARDFMGVSFPDSKRIVMNPPYAKNQHIKHFGHAAGMLGSGGILVAIMPGSFSFGPEKMNKLIKAGQVRADDVIQFRSNPDGSFKSSGTGVSTVTVKLTRP